MIPDRNPNNKKLNSKGEYYYDEKAVVAILEDDFEEEIEYSIVGSNEVDPLCGKISDQSPIGHALMGKSAGAEVVVEAPAGTISMKILEVTRK